MTDENLRAELDQEREVNREASLAYSATAGDLVRARNKALGVLRALVLEIDSERVPLGAPLWRARELLSQFPPHSDCDNDVFVARSEPAPPSEELLRYEISAAGACAGCGRPAVPWRCRCGRSC